MFLTIKNKEINGAPGLKVLLDDEIFIRVVDLPEDKKIKLHARRKDEKNQLWYSYATFTSDSEGVVNTAESTAIYGKYSGVDSTGLFWSMEMVETLPGNLSKMHGNEGIFLYIDVEIENKIVASCTIEVVKTLPEVKCEKIEEKDIVGNFYYPQKMTYPQF